MIGCFGTLIRMVDPKSCTSPSIPLGLRCNELYKKHKIFAKLYQVAKNTNERRIYGVWAVEERPPPHVVPTYHDSSSKKAGIDANHDDVTEVFRDDDARVYKEYC